MGSSPKNRCQTREGKAIRRFMLKRLPKLAKRGDIFIPFLGPMGHGKSTCINNLLGPDAVKLAPVGGGLEPCTNECALYAWFPEVGTSSGATALGQRIILIDTPGFDDALSVGEIISEVASCIQPLPKMEAIFAGAVLIMTSFRARFKVAPVQLPYALGQSLRLVIATTFWDICNESAGALLESAIAKVVNEMGLTKKVVGTARLIRGRQANPAWHYNTAIAALLTDDQKDQPGLQHTDTSGGTIANHVRLPESMLRGTGLEMVNRFNSNAVGGNMSDNALRGHLGSESEGPPDVGASKFSISPQKAAIERDDLSIPLAFFHSAHHFVINGPVTIKATVDR